MRLAVSLVCLLFLCFANPATAQTASSDSEPKTAFIESFRVTAVGGIGIGSVDVDQEYFIGIEPVSFETPFQGRSVFRYGLNVEYALPVLSQRFSVFAEPGIVFHDALHYSWIVVADQPELQRVSLRSLELPVGLRFSQPLSDKLCSYLNSAVVFDLSFNSSAFDNVYFRNQIKPKPSAMVGAGLRLADRILGELRYYLPRQLLGSPYSPQPDTETSATFQSLSLMVGVSF